MISARISCDGPLSEIATDSRNGSAAALDDRFVSRNRDSKITGQTISRAVDRRDATGIQQMLDERSIVVEHLPLWRPSPEKRGAVGEEIEPSVRFQTAEARYRIENT